MYNKTKYVKHHRLLKLAMAYYLMTMIVLILAVVDTVLQKDKHVLDGAILKVTASNNMRCLPDREEAEESRVIEVRGLAAATTKDSICMFFENTRRSGGGDVEHVDYSPEQGIAIVTFVKAESK